MPAKKKVTPPPATPVKLPPLLNAVRTGDLAAVQKLTKAKSAKLEGTDPYGNTALFLACFHGSCIAEDMVKYNAIALHLIEAGANVNAMNADHVTSLHVVQNKAVAEALIAKGASAEALTIDGRSPLRYAAATGRASTLTTLAGTGAAMDAKDEKGNTALHIAASTCLLASVKALTAKKLSDIRIKNNEGLTAYDVYQKAKSLVAVAESIDAEITELLTGKRARSEVEGEGKSIKQAEAPSKVKEELKPEKVYTGGQEDLLKACIAQKEIAALELIAAGANVRYANEEGETALHFTRSTKVAKALVAKGADIEALTTEGHTPLRLATINEDEAAQDALLDAGADVNSQGADGRTALHIAAASCMWWIIKPLTRTRDLDTSIEDNNGQTAEDVFDEAKEDVDFTCDEEHDMIVGLLQ